MSTLYYSSTQVSIFNPVSAALGALSNGAATLIALVRLPTSVAGGHDILGMSDAGGDWYHGIHLGPTIYDDDGLAVITNSTLTPANVTDWFWLSIDWPSGAAGVERAHMRNQTTLGAWQPSAMGANGGMRAGPGTAGRFRIGYALDSNPDQYAAVIAVWAGTRFADSDFGDWRKTSDLWNHPLGRPTLLTECTSTTLADLVGGSTFNASLSSPGPTLTGPDPDNFAFDQTGTSAPPGQGVHPSRMPLGA